MRLAVPSTMLLSVARQLRISRYPVLPPNGSSADSAPRYGHSLVEIDPKAEAKLRLKIDLMIVPTVFLLYLFCFIDRANIGKFCSPPLGRVSQP
jgi:hypothetical protein